MLDRVDSIARRSVRPHVIAALALALGVTLVGARTARAQFDPPALPTIYMTAADIDDAYTDGSRWLFAGQSGWQVIEAHAQVDRYCEETDFSFLPVGVTARLSAGISSFGGAYTLMYDMTCNYISFPGTHVATPTAIYTWVDTSDADTVTTLKRAARANAWSATVNVDPVDDTNTYGTLFEGGSEATEVTDNTAARTFTADHTFALLSGVARIAGIVAHIDDTGTAYVIEDSIQCGGGMELRGADLRVPTGEGWQDVVVSVDDLPDVTCAFPSLTSKGVYDLDVFYISTPPMNVQGTVAGLAVNATIALDYTGIRPLAMSARLPSGHTLHELQTITVDGRTAVVSAPRGTQWAALVQMSPSVVGGLDQVVAETTPTHDWFVVSRDLPLGFRVHYLTLDPQRGLVGSSLDSRYLRAFPVARLDARSDNFDGIRSNDIWLGGAVPEDDVVVSGTGLETAVESGTGAGKTAFPRGTLTFVATPLSITRGALEPQHVVHQDFALEQRTACPGCSQAGDTTRAVKVELLSDVPSVAADGATFMRGKQNNREVGFGPAFGPTATSRPTFLRDGDLGEPVSLVLPGYRLDGDSGATAAASLLGAWATQAITDASGVNTRVLVDSQPVTAASVRKGNGFFAGLNIGPETYSNAQNQPEVGGGRDLTGTKMSIGFPDGSGGRDVRDIPANFGAKFVVRGTVTGVFNTDAANSPQPQVYGYDFQFKRFAFSVIDSALQPYTWIDGKVSVHGFGEFGIPFVSLGLTCIGQLAGGTVDFVNQTPQTLRAWKTPYDIQDLAFKAVAPDTQCSTNPRKLWVGGALDVKAMAKTVKLEASWTNDGKPGPDAKLAPVDARLDRRSDAEPGFPVQTKADKLVLGYDATPNYDVGWFLFDAKLFVPFWEALDVKLRLQNVASGTAVTAAPSLVVPVDFAPPAAFQAAWTNGPNSGLSGLFSSSDTNVTKSLTLDAKMNWVFPLGGPVKWQPPSASQPGRFVASVNSDGSEPKKSIGSIVSLKSAVPYITHANTQYTFGMDADLRKLADVSIPQIKIDLKDPESLGRIDDFLARAPLSISGRPLTTALGGIRGAINQVTSVVKGLFGPALKETLRTVIKTVFNETAGPLLDFAANAVKGIQTTAQQAITAVFDPLRGLVDGAAAGLLSGPEEALKDVYATLPQTIVELYNATDNQTRKAKREAIIAVKTVIEQAKGAIVTAKTFIDGVSSKADQARNALTALRNGIDAKATTALCTLRNPALAPILSNPGYSCPGGQYGLINMLDPAKLAVLKCDESNPIIKQIKDVKDKVQAFTLQINQLAGAKLQGLVDAIAKVVGVNSDGFVKSLGLADGYAKLLNEKIDGVYTKIIGKPGPNGAPDPNSFCGKTLGGAGNKLASIADKARDFLESVRSGLAAAKGKITSAVDGLLAPNGALAAFKASLDKLTKFANLTSNLATYIEQRLNVFINESVTLPTPAPTVASVRNELDKLIEPLGVELGDSNLMHWCSQQGCPNGSTSFVTVLGDKVTKPVYDLIGQVEQYVGNELANVMKLLPLPSRDDLLQHLTGLIVNSPVIDEIGQLVNENLTFLEDKANEIVNLLLDQLTLVIQAAIDKVTELLAAGLKAVTEVFSEFPIQAASIKGFTDIVGNQVMKLQVDAHFDMNKAKDGADKNSSEAKSESSFDAQLKVESWANNGKAASCGSGGDLANAYDVTIAAMNLPFRIGGSDGLKISLLKLGFSINGGVPIGIFGGIDTTGQLALGEFKLQNIAFRAAVGKEETYIGAHAMALFQGYNCEVGFFVGRACNFEPLRELDREIVRFIPEPSPPKFFGVYVHGGVQVPIIDGGCALRIALGAEAALWVFDSSGGVVIGGLIGGSIMGKALCFVSIRGAIRVAVSYSAQTDSFSGAGEFFAGGGIGFSCDPETWTSVAAIRDDGGCATVDVSAGATFAPLSMGSPSISGID